MEINKKALIFWLIFFGYFTLFYFDTPFIRELTGILLLILIVYMVGTLVVDSIFGTDLIHWTVEKMFELFD